MIRCLPVSRMGSLLSWCGVVCLGFFCTLLTVPRAEARNWKYLSELSEEERRNIDPRTDTPRHATLPYLPAEPYPFAPPYTVEEMGIRAMEFPHIARWNFAMIEDFGSVMPTGYLTTGKTIVLSIYPEPEGLVGYINSTPGRSTRAGFRKTRIRRRIWAIKCSCSSTVPTKLPLPRPICLSTLPSCVASAAFPSRAGKTGSLTIP